MATTSATAASDTQLPPGGTGSKNEVQSNAMGAAATVDLWAGLGSVKPTGKVYVTFQAVGGDCTLLAFGGSGVVATNSIVIPANSMQSYWLSPSIHTHMRVAGSAGTIKWFVSSPEYEGIKTP